MRLGSFAWRGFGYGTLLMSVITAGAVVQSGCGGDDGKPGGSGGASSGGASTGGASSGGAAAGGSSPGGSSSGGSTTSTGGASSGTGGGAPMDPSCNKKVVDTAPFPACTTCTGGRCVPNDFLGTTENLDTCSAGGVCLPDAIVETDGKIELKKCSSVLGNEGRCSSLCLPAARTLSAVLPQDTCAAEERCAPCFNPKDGTPTGICNFGCDKGPTTTPITFTKCCGGRGDCVPRSNIPGNAKDNLAPETCTAADTVCVPSKIVDDPTYRFPKCTANIYVGRLPFPAGDGVCIPSCIVDATEFGPYLRQENCAEATDKCVPCNDPRTMMPSGACL